MGDSESPNERRDFFRALAGKLIRPLLEPLAEPASPPRRGVPGGLLRPPGAVADPLFNELCQRCGKCVQACPVQAIAPLSEGDLQRRGTPVIDADVVACVVCDGLHCTHVCPSGAILPVSSPHEIRMGVAEVYATLCVRSGGDGCRTCVDRCPLGAAAIQLVDEGPPEVLSPGCVGCGVCQLYCPTSPKAIVVQAR